jgi:radical SAM protein with 4Fe4S-binding SPASM domain
MVMTLNKHDIWDMKKYAEELGVEFRFDPVLNLRMDGDHKPADFRISPEEIIELDLADEKRMRDWLEFCEKFQGPPTRPEYLYECGAGLSTFNINSYGQLSVCIMSRFPSFDLLQGDFRKGWYDFIPNVLTQKWLREVPCKSCELISLCGQCPGWAQVEHGDQEKPVEYLCRIAHARAEAFGLTSLKKGGKR